MLGYVGGYLLATAEVGHQTDGGFLHVGHEQGTEGGRLL